MTKTKEYSDDFRQLIIQYHLLGKSLCEIAEIVRTAKATVQSIVNKYKKMKTIKTIPDCGRKRKITHTVSRIKKVHFSISSFSSILYYCIFILYIYG
jgi:transposase